VARAEGDELADGRLDILCRNFLDHLLDLGVGLSCLSTEAYGRECDKERKTESLSFHFLL
jgi:hypothetical protein